MPTRPDKQEVVQTVLRAEINYKAQCEKAVSNAHETITLNTEELRLVNERIAGLEAYIRADGTGQGVNDVQAEDRPSPRNRKMTMED